MSFCFSRYPNTALPNQRGRPQAAKRSKTYIRICIKLSNNFESIPKMPTEIFRVLKFQLFPNEGAANWPHTHPHDTYKFNKFSKHHRKKELSIYYCVYTYTPRIYANAIDKIKKSLPKNNLIKMTLFLTTIKRQKRRHTRRTKKNMGLKTNILMHAYTCIYKCNPCNADLYLHQ